MNTNEAIERLCALASRVSKTQFENRIPSDCLCAKRSPHDTPPVIDEQVVAFIENAVMLCLFDGNGSQLTNEEQRLATDQSLSFSGRLRAIKAVKERKMIGLAEAKTLVDEYLKSKGIER
jgi:hypothetical protein